MKSKLEELRQIQQMVVDLVAVNRYSFIARTDKRENVAEHSLSVALLCWAIHSKSKLPLDIGKILKYAIVHDTLERGLAQDTNTYASVRERELKKRREIKELEKIKDEFAHFEDMTEMLQIYENRSDEEALFVWSVDKIQQSLLGEMDNWRCYKNYGITYQQYCAKNDEFICKCSPYIHELFQELFKNWKQTYYDQPLN